MCYYYHITFGTLFAMQLICNYGVREGALRRKYMLTYIFFVRPLLEHGVYEKVPYKNICLRICFS